MTESTAGLHRIAKQTVIEDQQDQHDIVNFKLEMNTLLKANSQTSTTLQKARGSSRCSAWNWNSNRQQITMLHQISVWRMRQKIG